MSSVCDKYKGKLDELFKPKQKLDYNSVYNKFYDCVIETNKLIGLDVDKMSKEDRISWWVVYSKLLKAEEDELEEAILSGDKAEVVKEAVDVLVVGYMLFKLVKGFPGDLYVTLIETKDFLKNNDHHINVQKAIDYVLEENLSKFPKPQELLDSLEEGYTLEEAIADQCFDLENGVRYSGVYCETVVDSGGYDRLVFWCTKEYGEPVKKYLKPRTFKKKDFNDCLI